MEVLVKTKGGKERIQWLTRAKVSCAVRAGELELI